MFHLRDGAKCPWLGPASCHLPLSQGIHCCGEARGWSCVQDSGCEAGGAVCSGRNVHARGAKQASGTSAPLGCPGSTQTWGPTCTQLLRADISLLSHSEVAVPVSCWPSGMSHSPREPHHSTQ